MPSLKVIHLALVAALAGLVLTAGCGGEEEPAGTETEASTTAPEPEVAEAPEIAGERMKPVKAKETLAQAVERIQKTVESGDCKKIAAIFPVSRESTDQQADCDFLTAALNGEVIGFQEFGGGGLIDLQGPDNGDGTAVTILDSDGRHHVSFVDTFLAGGTVGTDTEFEPDPGIDKVAEAAVDALQEEDCEAFQNLTHKRFGVGASPDESQICTFVKDSSVREALEEFPKTEVESLGGNDEYGFYGLETPAGNQTFIVAVQEDPETLPEGFEPLPEDARKFGFVTIYPTYTAREGKSVGG